MHKIVVTTNNVIIIGRVTETDDEIIIEKPYTVTNNGQEYVLQPFLQAFTAEEWDEARISKDNIFVAKDVTPSNPILEAYLQKITGIDTGSQEIILG